MTYIKKVKEIKPTMTLNQVLKLKAIEKAAKDAFYASAKTGAKFDKKLYEEMVAATRARQVAMNIYASSLATEEM